MDRENIKQVLTMIEKLLKFPYPQICRHSVCCELIDLLEQNGLKMDNEFVKAVVQARDCDALNLLNSIKR